MFESKRAKKKKKLKIAHKDIRACAPRRRQIDDGKTENETANPGQVHWAKSCDLGRNFIEDR